MARHHKALSAVERAFGSLKTVDLHSRPIHHWVADRVRSHIFLYFRTLLADLSTIVRNTCRARGQDEAPTFTVETTPTPTPRRAYDLLKPIA